MRSPWFPIVGALAMFACSEEGSVARGVGDTGALDGTGGLDGAEAGEEDGALAPGLPIEHLELGQSHLIPPEGKRWETAAGPFHLELVGRRATLALLRSGEALPEGTELEALVDGVSVGAAPLQPPEALPPTEAGGPAYADDLHVAHLEAEWIAPGLELRLLAPGHQPGPARPVSVGVDAELVIYSLPFYLFGADESDHALAALEASMAEIELEYADKHPVAALELVPHPAGAVRWPYLVRGPTDGLPARRWQSADDYESGGPCAQQEVVLDVLRRLLAANGDGPTDRLSYAPIIQRDAQGERKGVPGGCGGGKVGTGDFAFAGIFIHEIGHALQLPHAAGWYDAGVYPYPGGSLEGSAWGYDAVRDELLAPFVSADPARDCTRYEDRRYDELDRCIKQDPMQSGAGDQSVGYAFTMFSDFSVARMQRFVSGVASMGDDGEVTYDEGLIFVDDGSPTGYSRWDSLDRARVPVTTETQGQAIYGYDRGLPETRDVPVHAIVFTISAAQTPDATQIYPPLSFVGNLVRTVDPNDPLDLADIDLEGSGSARRYCRGSGCDYTLRVSYTDGTETDVLVRGAFRPWWGPEEPVPSEALDPLDSDSFRTFAVQVPGAKPLARVELLHTPMAWKGIDADPPVLAEYLVP